MFTKRKFIHRRNINTNNQRNHVVMKDYRYRSGQIVDPILYTSRLGTDTADSTNLFQKCL